MITCNGQHEWATCRTLTCYCGVIPGHAGCSSQPSSIRNPTDKRYQDWGRDVSPFTQQENIPSNEMVACEWSIPKACGQL